MLKKLEAIYNNFLELEGKLSDPATVSDMKLFSKINKEYKSLQKVADAYLSYRDIIGNIETAQEMLKEDDADMKEMARMELDELLPRKKEMDEEIKLLLIPKDPEDALDVVLEIRAGTGGDEASIFAGDLYRMYIKYFDSQGFKVDLISANEGTAGGYSKLMMEIKGENVYGRLKFESGAHRVQRVPKTESQGRVHTSAASVVVMPKYEIEDININKADLRVDTFRSSGAGGQHVNKTESGVRFTHLPTGIAAESTDARSQHKNRDIALGRLYQKVREAQQAAFDSKVSGQRKSLVGSGDRSDKIRTYNYPQNRVTDHRINLTLYSLDKIIEGDIGGIIEALLVAENANKMQGNQE